MSYDMSFKGTLHFASKDALESARADVQLLLEEEEEHLAEFWADCRPEMLSIKGTSVTFDIDLSAPASYWFALEAIVETWAATATSGRIDSSYDGDECESFGPDADE